MNLRTQIKEELWNAISNTYEADNYSHAILDAMHYLSDVLREKAGVDGDGVDLVGRALGGRSPKIRINNLQTETEKNVQNGILLIVKGLYRGVRNPRSHEQISDSKETADAIIKFVDYLLQVIGAAEEKYTIENFKERVFDPEFVDSSRYARLLVAEIPPRRLLDTLIEIYRDKDGNYTRNIELIINEILEKLSDEQKKEYARAVSEELKTTQSYEDFRLAFALLPSELWPQVEEVARLRSEQKTVASIKDGWMNPSSGEFKAGALGTWASSFVKHFEKKFDLRSAI